MMFRRGFGMPFSAHSPVGRFSFRSVMVGPLSAALGLSLLAAPAWAKPGDGFTVRPVPKTASVSGKDLVPPAPTVPPQHESWKPLKKADWPVGGVADVTVPVVATGTAKGVGSQRARAGTLPISVGRPTQPAAGAKADARSARTLGSATAAPDRVHVTLADHGTAERAGVQGLLLSLQPVGSVPATAAADVQVDYSDVESAFAAGWSSRLRLVQMPACALTTPSKVGCLTSLPLPTDNDSAARTLTSTVSFPPNQSGAERTAADSGMVVLAATAGTSGDEGSFKATSLAQAGSWSAGGNSGAFGWDMPLAVPPVPGSLEPNVALSYSSSSVDGRTSSTNNQTSWIGEGWEYSPGFIERTYASCENDKQGGNNTAKVGDLCWKSPNATLSLNGKSSALVWDAGKNTWKLANDDGSRVEQVFGSSPGDVNGDADNEYWKVTALDGTQYWFGKNRLPNWTSGKEETNSVFTVPVYGNHTGEPGHGADFASSAETQGWRWNLDYVVDPHNDAMALYYAKETGYYAQNGKIATPVSYIRGGYLNRIDYGLRVGAVYSTTNPAGRVTFGTTERCLASCGTFDAAHSTNWPDVPVDLNCTAGTQCLQTGPSFWSRKRLTDINTFALQGSTLQPVDTWTLAQSFPPTGDVSTPTLWLDSIQHTAKAGSLPDITLPKTTFGFGNGPMPNRVNAAEGRPPLNKYRLGQVTNETGGQILITYSPTECTPTDLPTPDQNTKRCYPSWWTPDGAIDPVKDWFHKYVVTQIVEDDTTAGSGSPSTTTTYQYESGPNWRRDTSEFTVDKHRSWSDFRGYGLVRTLTGATNRTKTETSYFLGMSGDTLANGSPRTVHTVNGIADRNDFSGRIAEARTFDKDGTGGKVVAKSTYLPWESDPTATQPVTGVTDPDKPSVPGPSLPAALARHSGTVTEKASTLTDDGTSWRTLTTNRVYDTVYGLVTAEGDGGDTAHGVEPNCTRTSYVTPDITNWLISYPAQVTNVDQGTCGADYPPTAVTASTRTSYDNSAPGAAPTPGQANATKTEEASKLQTGGQLVWDTTSQSVHDQYGRVTTLKGQDAQPVTTVYTPATGAQPTMLTVTNVKAQSTTTVLDGLRGLTLKTTDANQRTATSEYDALGRLTKGWSTGRPTSANPNATFTYNVSATVPSTVTSKNLYEDGTWGTSIGIYDSLLRQRQTQTDAVGTTGRVVTDTFYDTLGRPFQTDAPFYNDKAVSTTLLTVVPDQIPVSTVTEFDGRNRPTAVITLSLNAEKWRTTTSYGDTWTSTAPPTGGTATLTVSNIRGQTTELRQYKDRNPLIGAAASQYEKITYAYDRAGKLSKVTDASGRNSWTYGYDLRGRQITASDPDKGASATTYGSDGQVATVTDARGITLANTYDELGRKTSLRTGSTTGTKLAEWAYDTASGGKGLPASSIRYDTTQTPVAAYTTAVTGYDSAGQATGTKVTVPSVTGEEMLAGTYTVASTYTPVSGLPTTTAYSTGNANATTALPAETVTNHYGAQDQLGIVDGTLSQVYLRGTSYTPYGELAQAQLGNTGAMVVQTLGYDAITHRLASTLVDRQASGPQTLSNIKYTYDTAGNITRVRDDQNDGTIADDQCFAYDWARRLSEAWTTADACTTRPDNGTGTPALGTVDPYWTSWTFTNSADRATETQHKAGPITANTIRSYTYPTTTGVARPHAVLNVTAVGGATGTDTYQYDEAGNLTTKTPATGAAQGLTWNDEGSLATSTVSGATTKFVYDTQGTRLLKREPAETTLYLPGGQELVLTKSTNALAGNRYYAVPGGSAIRTSSDARVRLLVADPHGTNTLSISATTLAVNRRKTLPYGAPRGTTPTFWPGQKGFVGGDIDTATGYTHLGARDYDTTTGRFISVDPQLDLADPQSLGGYGYSDNSPVTLSDPTGLGVMECMNGTMSNCSNGVPTSTSRYDKTKDPREPTPERTWINDNSPSTTQGGGDLSRSLHPFMPNQPYSGNYWFPTTNAPGSGESEVACFGRLACAKAYTYILGHPNDVAGAQEIAATYCIGHFEECAKDAAVSEASKNLYSDTALMLAGGAKLPDLGELDDVAAAIRAGLKNGCKNSFSPDTPVLLADGTSKPIGELKVGDKVAAADPGTGKYEGGRTVTATMVNSDDNLLDLTVQTSPGHTSVLHTTTEHPFWDDTTHAWVNAVQLTPGHALETDNNAHVVVTAVRPAPGAADMHNLTVSQLHTYYVLAGVTPVLVHNSPCPVGPGWFPHGSGKIPNEWSGPSMTRKFKKNDSKEGFVWRAPKGQDSVRIDKGDPGSQWGSQQVDHVIINSGGRIVGRGGQLLPAGARIQDYPVEAHVPLSEWQTWRNWNAP
ncbi:polymorphic toxin-type HINT domain-containing protein [Streptomyces sp. NPDC003300]|uniref:polymorphic toxin-type HINT domain-containing protein n=1 Tax=unclassified Streptomyces TaxID=2593676 RepID=UPI0033BC2DD1